MALSWRFPALLATGLIPLIVLGTTGELALVVLGVWIGLCLVVAAIDLLLAASPRKLRVERGPVERIRLGETASPLLAIEVLGSRTFRGVVRDAWEPSAGGGRMRVRATIPAGERRLIRVNLLPTRRGTRRSAFVAVRSFGPLGVAARQASLKVPGELKVLPPFNARKHLPSRLARLRELDGRTSLMVRGQGTEFDSLRDYVRGDDIRSIDWRATARRQDLVVRTWRPERDRHVVIIIDSGRSSAARVDDEARLDTAIESALLLAALASRAGDHVEVLTLDRLVRARVQGVGAGQLLTEIVELMADVEPQLIEPDWDMVPALVASVTTQRSLVVLLSTHETPEQCESLFALIPQLARRHLTLVASVSDPDAQRFTTERLDAAAVYRAAAAERARLDARHVAEALAQLGADVLSATPKELPPQLADRYLALKKSGRL